MKIFFAILLGIGLLLAAIVAGSALAVWIKLRRASRGMNERATGVKRVRNEARDAGDS